MLRSRKSFVKDKDGTESPTYLWQQVVYKTVGSCRSRYQHSAIDILKYNQKVRTGGYSIPLSPLRAVFKKRKEKEKKNPVDRQREQEAYRWGEG